MENSASSPHSRGNLSPLHVSGASAHEAMQNAAPEAPVINLASSDDASVNTEDHVTTTVDPTNQSPNQLLRAPKLPSLPLPSDDPEPLPSDDPESSSHGDCSDDDYVPPSKSPHSATMSPNKPFSFKSPAKYSALALAPGSRKSSIASPASLCSSFGRDAGMSFSDALSSLVRTHKRACRWTSGPIFVDCCLSLSDDTTTTIDIVPTLGHRENPPKSRHDKNCYFLPRKFNKNEAEFRKKFIHPLLIKACAKAGFNATCKYQLLKSSCIPKIRVSCVRGRRHDETSNKKHNALVIARVGRKTTVKKGKGVGPHAKRTQRPVPSIKTSKFAEDPFLDTADAFMCEERSASSGSSESEYESDNPDHMVDNSIICSFVFSAYFDEGLARWFFPKEGNGNAEHRGHPHIEPHLIRLRTDVVLDEDERRLTRDAQSSRISSAAARNLLFTRTGQHLEWSQIHHLYKKDQAELLITQGLTNPSRGTAVDRLIAYAKRDPKISFIMLFAESNSDLITIKQRKLSANKADTVDKFEEDLGDLVNSPMYHARALRDRLIKSKTGQILLAFAWTSDESRRKFDMFPEILTADDTKNVNSEERDLHSVIGQDSNRQLYVVLNIFNPSAAQWAFTWGNQIAFPFLHPGSGRNRVRKYVTDADCQLVNSIDSVARAGPETYAMLKAKAGLCVWHRLDRDCTNDEKFKSTIAMAKDASILARAEIDAIIRWMWYFARNYETEEEIKFASKLLVRYLSGDQSEHLCEIDEVLRKKLREFCIKSYFHLGRKLFDAYFSGMTMGLVTSSNSEVYHRATKKAADGTRPDMDLHESATALNFCENRRNALKGKRAAYDATSIYGKSQDRKNKVDQLTSYCNTQLGSQHDHKDKYLQHRLSQYCFYVKRDYVEYDPSPDEDVDHLSARCQSLLEKAKDMKDGVGKREKKSLTT